MLLKDWWPSRLSRHLTNVSPVSPRICVDRTHVARPGLGPKSTAMDINRFFHDHSASPLGRWFTVISVHGVATGLDSDRVMPPSPRSGLRRLEYASASRWLRGVNLTMTAPHVSRSVLQWGEVKASPAIQANPRDPGRAVKTTGFARQSIGIWQEKLPQRGLEGKP